MTDDLARLAAELVDEFQHNYARGRATFAVDALSQVDVSPLTGALAAEFETRGRPVTRVAIPDANAADAFRALVLPTFRGDADLAADAVLLAEGTGLHAPGIADVWNLSVWVTAGAEPEPADEVESRYLLDVDPPRRADAIVDVADPEKPARRFSDWCVVPRRPRS